MRRGPCNCFCWFLGWTREGPAAVPVYRTHSERAPYRVCVPYSQAILCSGARDSVFLGFISGYLPISSFENFIAIHCLLLAHYLLPPAGQSGGGKYLSLRPPGPSPQPWLTTSVKQIKAQMHLKILLLLLEDTGGHSQLTNVGRQGD